METVKPEAWERLLARLERDGVSFYLNGKRSGSREIIRKCRVCENAVYMPDFVTDEAGKLREVRYDEVKRW